MLALGEVNPKIPGQAVRSFLGQPRHVGLEGQAAGLFSARKGFSLSRDGSISASGAGSWSSTSQSPMTWRT